MAKLLRPKPWFAIPLNSNPNKHVIVIGGGISGAATAHSLAKRGYKVTIYEKQAMLAMGASGNYQGILYGNFYGNYTPMLELSFAGFQYSYNLIKNTLSTNEYQNSGLIQLAYNPQLQKQQQQLLMAKYLPDDFCYKVDNKQIQEYSNLQVNCQSGLYFPEALWLSPAHLVKKLCAHPNIKVICNTHIDYINQNQNNKWEVYANNTKLDQAYNIVLCNAHDLQQFSYTQELNLRKIRGQLSLIKTNIQLKSILCANSYITPNLNEYFTIGATFKFNDHSLSIRETENNENINNITKILPQLKSQIKNIEVIGQTGIRATSSDYFPLVGPLAKHHEFITLYKNLSKDSNYWIEDTCPYLTGLYINAAHGAKGLLSAPISGELIAQYIDNTPFSTSEELRLALHPNRFWLKGIIKGKYAL